MKYIAQKSLIWFLLILFSGMLFAQGEGYALTLNSDAENFVCCHRTNWNLGGSDGMTVSAWVRWSIVPSESDHYWANIISNNSVTHNDIGQFWLQHDMENELFEFAVSADSRRWIYGTTVPQKDVWYHVVGIYNDNAANSMQIWVNGVMENEINTLNGNISAFSSNYITKIGRWSSSSESRSFDGSIDEVSIWSRALDSTEIQSLKNNTLPADTSGLEAYWDFNTGHDDILQDQSGKNRDGTIFSAYHGYGNASGGSGTTLQDDSDIWYNRDWSGHIIHILSGTGVEQTGTVQSNTATVLTLSGSWENGSSTPDWSSKYGLSADYRWAKYVSDQTMTSVGPAGRQMNTTITSSPDEENHLLIMYQGWLPTDLESDETLPAGMMTRANFSWIVDDIGSVTADLVFDYSSVAGISDPSDVEICIRDNYEDMTWNEVTESSRNNTARTITVNGAVNDGEYVLCSRNINDLPSAVEISDFSIAQSNHGATISWCSETETANLGYCLERRLNDGEWNLIADYQNNSELSGAGNSSTPKDYRYQDFDLFSGNCYEYRLLDVPAGGHSSVVAAAELYYEIDESVFVLNSPSPNPFNPETAISFTLGKPDNVVLSVLDMRGRTQKILMDSYAVAGYHSIDWHADHLPSGIYFIRLQYGKEIRIQKCCLLK